MTAGTLSSKVKGSKYLRLVYDDFINNIASLILKIIYHMKISNPDYLYRLLITISATIKFVLLTDF